MAAAPCSEATSGSALNSGVAMKRPNGGKKWSEVCEQVQKPDGSVRIHLTSPPFKNSSAPANSPQHLRPTCLHIGGKKRGSGGRSSSMSSRRGSSRGGSSRGRSSGISSRSSSREKGREGDISSRCSSGGCGWDTSTNASEHVSDTPREDAIDGTSVMSTSPLTSKSLLMPNPIRPLAMLAGERDVHAEGQLPDDSSGDAKVTDVCNVAVEMQEDDRYCEGRTTGDGSPMIDAQTSTTEAQGEFSDENLQGYESSQAIEVSLVAPDAQLGLTLKLDPLGRDAPRGVETCGDARQCQTREGQANRLSSVLAPKRSGPSYIQSKSWSVEPLAKYLQSVVDIVETNINKNIPVAEKKLDAFVAKLVMHLHRQCRHAPHKVRPDLTKLCARRFGRFHDFTRNQRLMTPSPEELKVALSTLVEALLENL